jgi:hypothetical protein
MSLAAVCLSLGCGSGAKATPDVAPASAAAPSTAAAPASAPAPALGETVVVQGTLQHHPLPEGKNFEAYMGREFLLAVPGGEAENLKASAEVSRDELLKHAGRTIRVTCQRRAPFAPDPMSSYPVNGDGSPVLLPAACIVRKIEAVATP